jgi:hypothetical protein
MWTRGMQPVVGLARHGRKLRKGYKARAFTKTGRSTYNSQTSSTTRKSPYKIGFKQRMRDPKWLLPNEKHTASVPEMDDSDGTQLYLRILLNSFTINYQVRYNDQ